jgi:hypothetical protein
MPNNLRAENPKKLKTHKRLLCPTTPIDAAWLQVENTDGSINDTMIVVYPYWRVIHQVKIYPNEPIP